ncbi:MAG: hypothetical protein J1F35_06315 [Erysipelotrichales bacterium]|nr:hypothetical protein [Erysipelotrichales bacterium]
METTSAQIYRLELEIESLQEDIENIYNYVPDSIAKIMTRYMMKEMEIKIQKLQNLIAA